MPIRFGGSGAGSGNKAAVVPIDSQTVVDGNYDFDIGPINGGVDLFLDEFRFVDGNGDRSVATAGTVSVQVSSDGAFWRPLNDGGFSAELDTTSEAYTPPSGLAAVTKLRITLSGVSGVVGFRANMVRA